MPTARYALTTEHRFQDHSPEENAVLGGGFFVKRPPERAIRDRVTDWYGFVYLLGGTGRYWSANTPEQVIHAGDVILIFPQHRYSYHSTPPDGWSQAYMTLRGPLFNALEAARVIDRASPILSLGAAPAIEIECVALVREFLSEKLDPVAPTTIARVHLLLARMMEVHLSKSIKTSDYFLIQAQQALAAVAGVEDPDLRAIAQQLGMGYESFRRRFTEMVGMPPHHYRLLRRIDLAKGLLVASQEPIADIAKRLGYRDAFFFCRQFKRFTGLSPGRFRALH